MNESYVVMKKLYEDLEIQFKSNIVHLGGNTVIYACYDQKPSIKAWMAENNMTNYSQLHNYYINRSRLLINPKNTTIYWS